MVHLRASPRTRPFLGVERGRVLAPPPCIEPPAVRRPKHPRKLRPSPTTSRAPRRRAATTSASRTGIHTQPNARIRSRRRPPCRTQPRSRSSHPRSECRSPRPIEHPAERSHATLKSATTPERHASRPYPPQHPGFAGSKRISRANCRRIRRRAEGAGLPRTTDFDRRCIAAGCSARSRNGQKCEHPAGTVVPSCHPNLPELRDGSSPMSVGALLIGGAGRRR